MGAMEGREGRVLRESLGGRESREGRDVREGRESREGREGREGRGRGGPSLTTWCKVRAGLGAGKTRHHHDFPRDARRTLNAILRTSRRVGVRAEDLGRLRGAQGLLQARAGARRGSRGSSRTRHSGKSLAHDPDFLAAGILFALMIAVLAGVLAAMLVADAGPDSQLPGNKSVSRVRV